MKLLIDADYLAYKACASAEYDVDYGDDVIVVASNFSDALRLVEKDLKNLNEKFLWDTPELILFFSHSSNFRKKIYPAYKGHRNRKKPCGYRRLINKLGESYEVIRIEELEADDALGIYATANPGNVIVSPDKDLRQIPGRLHNMDETIVVEEEEGRRWHLIQTLAGDSTDGYSGAPGFGVKSAIKWFEENEYDWESVVSAFESKGLTANDALTNARLAKILTCNDYDSGPILWTPTHASVDTDNGAGSKTTSDN